jgi:16S rRNA (cytosine967-C5)-methyltransferase
LEQEEGQFNYPIWWIQKVKKQYKSNWKNILNIGNGHPPMTIRVNKRKIIMKEYIELLKENEISFIALANEGLILKDAKNIKDIPGFENGLFSVQDFGAQLASVLLDLKNDYLVLDACAAPGGKTTSMLENSNINLIALEKNTQRARKIIENLKRLKLEATVITQPLDNTNKWWNKKQFDRILLDVPCSASGIVRRHVDMKWLRRLSDLEKFADMQLDLLNNAWPLLKPQGKLLYVTCSIFKEENEEVILKFCDNRQDVKRGKLKFPKNIQHVKNQLIPSKDHDGLYYEILEKK